MASDIHAVEVTSFQALPRVSNKERMAALTAISRRPKEHWKEFVHMLALENNPEESFPNA